MIISQQEDKSLMVYGRYFFRIELASLDFYNQIKIDVLF